MIIKKDNSFICCCNTCGKQLGVYNYTSSNVDFKFIQTDIVKKGHVRDWVGRRPFDFCDVKCKDAYKTTTNSKILTTSSSRLCQMTDEEVKGIYYSLGFDVKSSDDKTITLVCDDMTVVVDKDNDSQKIVIDNVESEWISSIHRTDLVDIINDFVSLINKSKGE